jgi:predicted transcriptional regulator
MLELSQLKKNKVSLADYNSAGDIENRMLMANFSASDIKVLSEILYSPLKISMKRLAKSLDLQGDEIGPVLAKLQEAGLLRIEGDAISVDKEGRKYFEFQIARFDPDFKPDMEFLQGILKKVPIHLLPLWYAISRTSNNIFESIVEKYLLTPQIFQRYLNEINYADPTLQRIVADLFSAPDFRLSSSDIIAKYNLPRRRFEEIILFLELNFVCCLTYEKADDHWVEYVSPFHEWHEYLRFLKATDAPAIGSGEPVFKRHESDFGFVEDMSRLLEWIQKKPLPLDAWQEGTPLSSALTTKLAPVCSLKVETAEDLQRAGVYLSHLIEKLCAVKLADRIDQKLYLSEGASDWLDMTLENRSLYLYRHPLNRIVSKHLSPHVCTERNIREAEKSIKRVLHGNWVFFEDFLKGVLIPLSEESVISLKKTGRHWKYTLPLYGEDEKALLKAVVFEWLFETGMITIGTCRGRDCFAVTPFGRFFFDE